MRKSIPFTKLMVIIFILCMTLPSTLSVNAEQASNIQVDALGEPIGDNPGFSPLIDAPTLHSPSNGATIIDDTPVLDWNYVSDSIRYRIQVDNNADFSSMEFNEITDVGTGYTTYIECDHLNDDTYYWRVRSYNEWGFWSVWSSEWHFTLDSTGPNPPTLYSPSYGSTIYDSTPYLDWGPSSTAVLYKLQVADNSGFTGANTITTSNTYCYWSSALSNRNWYWRVCAQDSLGNWGSYSSYKYFRVDTTPPSLNSPYNGYLTQSSTLTLSWNAKSTASAYNVQVDDNPSFSSPYSYSLAGTSRTFTLSSDTWYWRVRAQDYRGSWGSFSSYRYFTIDNIAPGIPTLFAPTDGTMTNDQTPYLDWSTVATATQYHVQVDNNADFSSLNVNYYTSSSSYTCTTLGENTYYWRVQARDAAGNWGSWSTTWHFEIDTTPPATLTLLTPSNNSIDSDPTPYLEWSSETGAVLYQLQVDNDTDFLSTAIAIYTTDTYYTAITSLDDDVYYWRVRAKDGAENWGDWSDVWNFQVDTTAPEITDVVFDPSPTDLEEVFVYCNVTDSNGLDIVTLHYRVNSGEWTNITMIWAIDNQYEVSLGTFTYDDLVEFFISANDSCINPNIATEDNGGAYYSFTVVSSDVTGPTISAISQTPEPANDTETITISCDVYDANGIQSVTLYYRINGGSWTDVSMTFTSGSTYEATIGSFAYDDEIEYYIVAVDDSPNHNEATDDNSGIYYSFTIEASDIDGPTIENILHQPATPTELETITINCDVTDPSGVQSVTLYYRIDGGDWMSVSMTNIVDSTYNATIGLFAYEDFIEYYITAVDNYETHNIATDNNGGSYYSFTIGASDVSGPTINDIVHTPTNPTDAETVIISCAVTDLSGVQSVTLYYRVNSGSWTDASMTLTTGSTYEVSIGSFAYAADIEYYINATDSYITHNNATDDNSGNYYTFTIASSDVTAPTISDIEYNPNAPSDTDLVNITCTVSDLNGISSVVLHYRTNGGTWTTTTMLLISGDQYKTTIGTFAAADLIEFYITATDDSPNTNTATDDNGGAYYSFTVLAHSTSNTTLLALLPIVAVLALALIRKKR